MSIIVGGFLGQLMSACHQPRLAAGEEVSCKAKNPPSLQAGHCALAARLLPLLGAILLGSGTGALAQPQDMRRAESPTSPQLPCQTEPGAAHSVERQLCLSEHIPGFGGYHHEGPCEVAAYLADPDEASAERELLRRYVEAASPDCGDDLTIEFRQSRYDLVDLHRWGDQASALLLSGEEQATGIDAYDVLGPLVLDNRVNFFFDPEALAGSDEAMAEARANLSDNGYDLDAFHISNDPFSTRALSWYLLGVADPCLPVNPPLAICMNDPQVQVSLVDGSPTGVLGTATLRSSPDLSYVFIISWEEQVSLRDYARRQEEDMEYVLSNCARVGIGQFSGLRFDLEPAPATQAPAARSFENPALQSPRMVLFVDTGAGMATIVGTPRASTVSQEDLYRGAESVARIFRVRQ
ncbi:hypothetical protein OZN62_07595 [Aurantiacibacter sp. MUD11]|uniref:hypothetical protein n=1 Tax=Aurantiacibacter sp. MUD11 TaxID=3003265 RepID=UPI0022AAC2C1|nr:hypothetical protein [Aurantiacibacter sp. MUD11]WAT16809.1 hypothetical protein OZN62_07595 [Aurantiacibacter sp. MUD11]